MSNFDIAKMRRVLDEIGQERHRQNMKWGAKHDDRKTMRDFIEHIQDYAGWARQMFGMGSDDKGRRRLVNIAALAVAAIEALDRRTKPVETPFEDGFGLSCRYCDAVVEFTPDGKPTEHYKPWSTGNNGDIICVQCLKERAANGTDCCEHCGGPLDNIFRCIGCDKRLCNTCCPSDTASCKSCADLRNPCTHLCPPDCQGCTPE